MKEKMLSATTDGLEWVKNMDEDADGELSLLEWAVHEYKKNWRVISSPSPHQTEIEDKMSSLREKMSEEVQKALEKRHKLGKFPLNGKTHQTAKEKELEDYYAQIQMKLNDLHVAVQEGNVGRMKDSSSSMAKIVVRAEKTKCDLLHSPTELMKEKEAPPRGVLKKKAGRKNKWKSRYFVLDFDEGILLYYKNEELSTTEPKGRISLRKSEAELIESNESLERNQFMIKIRKKSLSLEAQNEEEKKLWFSSLTLLQSKLK